MADIQSKILEQYGIDISEENIFKLYKVESADISAQELEEKFAAARKRWNASINGANERNAERDRKRLDKADSYEKILKDAALRKQLYRFYTKGDGESGGSTGQSTDFAKEYFQLVATTKKIKKADVEFFFKYYKSERKNKKAILEMLSRDLKISGLGNGDKYADENEEIDEEGKKKNKNNPLVVNLFQEATILKIRKVIDKYEEAKNSSELCRRYPKLKDSLYAFLEIDDITDAEKLQAYLSEQSQKIYAVRQENGSEYIPLVDLFNELKDVAGYQDAADNILEFKLLLKYPNLTPYMFAFVDMKPKTLDGITDIANREYVFQGKEDFIVNYYVQLHDNFGISDTALKVIIRKAEKQAKANKIFNKIDEKLGREKKRKIGFGANLLYWLVYWPVFIVYFIFEVIKLVFTHLHILAVPIFLALLAIANWMFPVWFEMDNLSVLRKIISKSEWYAYLETCMGEEIRNGFLAVLASLKVILKMVMIYGLLPLFGTVFVVGFSQRLNKRYDWVGYDRTFQNILKSLRNNTEKNFFADKKKYYSKALPKVLVNLVMLFVLLVLVRVLPVGFRYFSASTGYFQKEAAVAAPVEEDVDTQEENSESQQDETPELVMVITEDNSNIRSGPAKKYDVLAVADKGETFIATGNQETAKNGNIWYEIYLDESQEELGWACETIIQNQEQ